MGIEAIAVHVDEASVAAGALEAAVALAVRHDAHLTGLHAIQVPDLPTFALAELPQSVLDAQRAATEARARDAEAGFREATERAGLRADWRIAQGPIAETIVRQGRHVDLLVVATDEDHLECEDVVLRAGPPVLVVPAGANRAEPGRRAIVAWNASREAARALHDALALLRAADSVRVVSITPRSGENAPGDLPTAEVCRHLARHGISAEGEEMHAEPGAVGATLLASATERDVDLLVMGAWGHSRFRELVLGGVTAHVLRHSCVPALLSH